MGRKREKLIERLLSNPKDFTNKEADTLMRGLGYQPDTKGRTSGSRIAYYKKSTDAYFLMHLSHPSGTLKPYVIKNLICHLKEHGEI
jgi:hypothetical protein